MSKGYLLAQIMPYNRRQYVYGMRSTDLPQSLQSIVSGHSRENMLYVLACKIIRTYCIGTGTVLAGINQDS